MGASGSYTPQHNATPSTATKDGFGRGI